MFIISDPEYSKMNKEELEEHLKKPDNDSAFQSRRERYEKDKNDRGGVRAPASGTSGKQTLSARSTGMTETKQFKGYLWPTAYWSKHNENKKRNRSQIGSTVHLGKKVVGVWMTEPGPDPLQAIGQWTVGQEAVDRVGELANTEIRELSEVGLSLLCAGSRVAAAKFRFGFSSKFPGSATNSKIDVHVGPCEFSLWVIRLSAHF